MFLFSTFNIGERGDSTPLIATSWQVLHRIVVLTATLLKIEQFSTIGPIIYKYADLQKTPNRDSHYLVTYKEPNIRCQKNE